MTSSQQYGNGRKSLDIENAEPEDGGFREQQFADEPTKKRFIFKVYFILLIQIIITGLIVFFLYENEKFRKITIENPIIFYISIMLMFILLLVMALLEKARKQAPLNYFLLLIFTAGESFLLAVGSIRFERHEVLIALILCGLTCVALIIFACQTAMDFTVHGTILIIIITFLFILGLVLMFFPLRLLTILYAAIGVAIFSFCLIYDTQLMLGGRHKHRIHEDDYCFAALSLYLDIINIFYYILLLIGFYNKY